MLLNWSKEAVSREINKAIEEGKGVAVISLEFNSTENELEVLKWVEESGYEYDHEKWISVIVDVRRGVTQ